MAEKMTLFCEMAALWGQGYCLHLFLSSFLACRVLGGRLFPERKRRPGGKTFFCGIGISERRVCGVLVSAGWGIMKAVLYELTPLGSESMSGFYKLLIQGVFLWILAFCFYEAEKKITVFLLVTFLALSEISFFIGYMVMNLSSPVLEWEVRLFTEGYIAVLPFEGLLRTTAAFLQVLCCASWIFLLAFSLRKVAGAFREKDYAMHRTELLFILTPPLAGLLLCALLRIIMVTVENGMPALLYDKYPVLRFLVPAILLLLYLSIFYSVKLFQDMICLSREKSSRAVLEQQIETLQEHTREVERLYEGVRSVKHDMGNTLAVLMRLSGTEYAAYLAELNKSFERLELRFRTGNAVADALLNMKYHEAVQKIPGLKFDADDLLFTEDIVIQSHDISVILGNALDNAIEACVRLKQKDPQGEQFIRLSSFRKGKFFFIEAENSFDGVLRESRHGEFPETLKEERQIHGIGFSNMKKTAEKYDGAVDYSVIVSGSDPERAESASGYAIFTLSVMMKNERRKENTWA